MFKKSKSILILALVLLLCFASITPAFATNLNADGAAIGTEANPAQATITKHLRLPIGTITPNATFTFEAKKMSVDGNAPATDAAMPSLNSAALTVSFTAADRDPTDPPASIMSIRKETGNLFSGVTFTHAGIYVYELRELVNTNPGIDNDPNQWLSYSGAARYTLTVYVENTEDGTGTFVSAVGVRVTVPDNNGQTANAKVDATPGGDGENYLFSQMVFTNDFVRTNGPDGPENPTPVTKSTLSVSKEVAGDFASRTQYFNFNMTLTVPTLVQNVPPFFRAYVVENGAVVNPAENVNVTPTAPATGTDAGGTYIQISTSGSTQFRLRAGQKLVFVDTPVGTRYTVEEAATPHYIPSVSVTTDNVSAARPPGTLNSALSTSAQRVGERANSADFTNTRDSVTPTGLNLNDLPFIGMVILAAGALIIFLVVKVRKSRQAYSC